jgi:membrane-bound ClpP family serine protease
MTQFFEVEHIVYAAIFGIGLLTSVYAMLHGSIRLHPDPEQITPPPAAFNTPVVGAATLAAGAVGYLASRYSELGTIPVLFLALVAAAGGWTIMTLLMAKWAFKGPIHDPHEEIEELQGTVAVVVKDIRPDELGEIVYTFRDRETRARARSIEGASIPSGTEVVIEKITDDIADVELWSTVEQRI